MLARYGIENPTQEQYDEMVEDLVAAGRSHFTAGGTEFRVVMKLDLKWKQDLSDAERVQLIGALKEPVI